MNRAYRFAALCALCLFSTWARPATFCVTAGDAGGLADALAIAQTNNDSDNLIQLESGAVYRLDAAHPQLSYHSVSATPKNLTIEGGYLTLGCGQHVTDSADASVIDAAGGAQGAPAFQLIASNGSIVLKSLTVSNASNTDLNGSEAVTVLSLDQGDVSLKNVVLKNNTTAFSPYTATITSFGGRVFIRNSVIADNLSLNASSETVLIRSENGAQPGYCIVITNSTLSGSKSNGADAVRMKSTNLQCTQLVANSIFWGNQGTNVAVILDSAGDSLFETNVIEDNGNFGIVVPSGTPTFVDLYKDTDPMFTDGPGGDYSLRDDSPLRDAGNDLGVFGGPGSTDVLGRQRTYGAHPDIGAYEVQDVIFANGFDQWLH
jgi:hypothetical protein